jgi:phosphoglycolate phosphatase-like HAD superfamily hydrolase
MILLVVFLGLAVWGYRAWRLHAHEEVHSGNLLGAKTPLVVFDFDGTICPSYRLFVDQLNRLAPRYGFRKIYPHELEAFRHRSIREAMKVLGVSKWQLPFLIKRIRRRVQRKLLDLEPVEGIVEMLQEMKKKGVGLGILTSNSEENVRLFFQKQGIDCFDFIYTGNNVFGKDGHLKKIRKAAGPGPLLYVGDEGRDMEAARRAKVEGIAVTWGYNSIELFEKEGIERRAQNVEELEREISRNLDSP